MRLGYDDMLPDRAFQPRGRGPFARGMTLEGGKGGGGGSAPAPDPNIGIAQRQMADLATSQYNDFKTLVWPELQRQSAEQNAQATKLQNQQYALNEKNAQYADDYMARMREKFYPLQDKVIQEASDYNTEGNFERQAALAMGDVNTAYDQARQNQNMQMMAYGINPNSGQFAGQNNANNIMQAATGAAAATKAREAARALGWSKSMDAIGLGMGLPGNQATSTSLAMSLGNSSLNAGQIPIQNTMALGNSLNQGYGGAMSGWGQVGNLGVQTYSNQISAYNAQQAANAQSSSGFGNMIGTVAGAALAGGTGGFGASAVGVLGKKAGLFG